jgi:hypothetical protein
MLPRFCRINRSHPYRRFADTSYEELVSVVTAAGVAEHLLHQKELENDWLTTVEALTEVAKLELLWETAAARPRVLEVWDPISLEVGDIIQLPDQTKLWVASWRKSYAREEVPVLELEGYRVPEGV